MTCSISGAVCPQEEHTIPDKVSGIRAMMPIYNGSCIMRDGYEKHCFSDDLISFNKWFRLFRENAEYPITKAKQVNDILDEMISIQQNILNINFGDNDYSQEKIDYLITKEIGKLEYLKDSLMTMRGIEFST